MYVDAPNQQDDTYEDIRIHLNMTLHKLPCAGTMYPPFTLIRLLKHCIASTCLLIGRALHISLLPTPVLSVDVQDVMGTHIVDVHGKLFKSRLSHDGELKVDDKGRPLEPGE